MHHTFTEHGRELKRALFGDAALTLVAHGHAAVNAFSAVTRTERLDDGTGVGLGLEQARHEHLLVGAHRGSFSFQANEVAVLAGQHITVGVPPTALASVTGELGQSLTLRLVGDAVYVERIAHVTKIEAGPLAGLDAGDLGGVPVEASGHVVASQSGLG